jgi:hypothetical protein
MKKSILSVALILSLVLIGFNVFADNGDLIVNGNVGIGTTTPVSKLDVSGDVRLGNSAADCTDSNEGAIHYNSTSKKMEFCNGSSWQQFVLIYKSEYPPAQSATYVKATSTNVNAGWYPYQATDPSKSLIGNANVNAWLSDSAQKTNQRFHIDLGSAKIIRRIYYENYLNFPSYGDVTNIGAKTFTFWGSNNATAFSTLTYGTDTYWTQLPTSQSTFDKHVGADVTDPKFITVTNSTAYRYYAIKIADDWGNTTYGMGLRRIELQVQEGYNP